MHSLGSATNATAKLKTHCEDHAEKLRVAATECMEQAKELKREGRVDKALHMVRMAKAYRNTARSIETKGRMAEMTSLRTEEFKIEAEVVRQTASATSKLKRHIPHIDVEKLIEDRGELGDKMSLLRGDLDSLNETAFDPEEISNDDLLQELEEYMEADAASEKVEDETASLLPANASRPWRSGLASAPAPSDGIPVDPEREALLAGALA